MAIFTTQLRTICENYSGLDRSGYDSIDEVIALSRPKVFDFDYPIFDEQYREELEKKIILHFYMREIGLETVGLWKLCLRRKMNEIMPYYNKLYDSQLIDFDPLGDVDVTTRHEGQNKSQNEDTSNGVTSSVQSSGTSTESESKDAFSDTPQGRLNDVEDSSYVSEYRDTKNTGSTESNMSGNTMSQNMNRSDRKDSSEFTDRITGKRGGTSFSKMLMEYRETFLKVDSLIFAELEPLFMGVWG